MCNHAPLTTDDTLDAMSLTHDAFTSEFRKTLIAAATCDVCGKAYFAIPVGMTAAQLVRAHKMFRHDAKRVGRIA